MDNTGRRGWQVWMPSLLPQSSTPASTGAQPETAAVQEAGARTGVADHNMPQVVVLPDVASGHRDAEGGAVAVPNL
jgi:hypothetical protein